MSIYYILISFWTIIYIVIDLLKRIMHKINWRLVTTIILSSTLFLVMALRHYSVGVDTKQYLYRYNNIIYPLNFSILGMKEWGFHGIAAILKNSGVSNQGYIAIISLIIIVLYTRFYYKYSPNMFFSFYLHLTIGLFSLSLSGVMQAISVGIILIAFDYMIQDKPIHFIICVVVAYIFHNSAVFFLPVYFLRNIKIDRKKGFILLLSFCFALIMINPVMDIIKLIVPNQYASYLSPENASSANPLVIIVALGITTFCLFFMNEDDNLDTESYKLRSSLLIMSLINSFVNVLSFNASIISRIAFYFVPFNIILIPFIINRIRNKGTKYMTFILFLFLALAQFAISTPDGTTQIDKYIFFWEKTGY